MRRWGIVLLLAVTLYCCKNESGTPGKVVIISTNDMHAQLARFPLLATLIQQKKAEGGEVIVVDAGDRFSGNPYVDHALERGEPMIRLMNEVGYDVAEKIVFALRREVISKVKGGMLQNSSTMRRSPECGQCKGVLSFCRKERP